MLIVKCTLPKSYNNNIKIWIIKRRYANLALSLDTFDTCQKTDTNIEKIKFEYKKKIEKAQILAMYVRPNEAGNGRNALLRIAQ